MAQVHYSPPLAPLPRSPCRMSSPLSSPYQDNYTDYFLLFSRKQVFEFYFFTVLFSVGFSINSISCLLDISPLNFSSHAKKEGRLRGKA